MPAGQTVADIGCQQIKDDCGQGACIPELQWLSLFSPAREESTAVPQVPCVPPETVVTIAEESEQMGPVETEAEQGGLLPAPSVSPQEVSVTQF